jgi:hypothetical protein
MATMVAKEMSQTLGTYVLIHKNKHSHTYTHTLIGRLKNENMERQEIKV